MLFTISFVFVQYYNSLTGRNGVTQTFQEYIHACKVKHSFMMRDMYIILSTVQVYRVYCGKQLSATTHNDDTTNSKLATCYHDIIDVDHQMMALMKWSLMLRWCWRVILTSK